MSKFKSITINFINLEKIFIIGVILSYCIFQRGFHESAPDYLRIPSILFLLLIEIITALLFIRHFPKIIPILHKNYLLIIISLIFILSSLWSVNTMYTFFQSMHLLLTTLLAFYIATRFDFKEYLNILFIGLSILALFSIIAIIIRPDQAIHHGLHEGGWRGIYFHKNGFGQEMLILALLSFTISHKKLFTRMAVKFCGILCLFFVVKSSAVTSIVAGIILLPLIPILSMMRFSGFNRFVLFIVLIMLISISSILLIENYILVLEGFGKSITLSNRIFIWNTTFQHILEKPLLGYGFDAFWLDQNYILDNFGWASPHAHNNILELLLDVGIIGASIAGIVFYDILKKGYDNIKNRGEYGSWFIVSIFILFLTTLLEQRIHEPFSMTWLIFSSNYLFISSLYRNNN